MKRPYCICPTCLARMFQRTRYRAPGPRRDSAGGTFGVLPVALVTPYTNALPEGAPNAP